MSLPVFEVKLQADPGLRRVVLISGVLAMIAGLVLLMDLDIAFGWRAAFCAVWIADCLRELKNLANGSRRVAAIGFDAGGAMKLVNQDGRTEPVRLLSGSLILPKIAWLRMRLPDGSRHAELLIAGRCETDAWHGFQLIWQQCREAFGHTLRA